MKAEVVIVGGGVTGLYLGKILGKEKPLLLTQEVGGLISSYEDEGFSFDYGGHVYTTEDKELNELMERAGAARHERDAIYLADDKQVPYPVQDFASELGMEISTQPAVNAMKLANLKEFGLAWFGPDFYYGWYGPFNSRVWTVDPVEMDTDWIRSRVKLPTEKKEKWGPNAEFQYAPGREISKWMYRDANAAGTTISHSTTVQSVDLDRKRLFVLGEREKYVEYERLYWTLPINLLAGKVGISEDAFKYNRVRTVGIGLKGSFIHHPFHWAYPEVTRAAHRITWLSRYHKSNAPQGQDSLLIEFPYRLPNHPLPLDLSVSPRGWFHVMNIGADRQTGLKALKYALGENGIRAADIQTVVVGDCKGYPIPTVGIRNIVAETKSRLLDHGIYCAGRWGSWGYFNIPHCFEDARVAAHGEANITRYLYSTFYYASK